MKRIYARLGLILQLDNGRCISPRHCFKCGDIIGWPIKEGLITSLVIPGKDIKIHNCLRKS